MKRAAFQSLGVFAAPHKPSAQSLASRLVALCEAHGVRILVQRECARIIGREDLACAVDDEIAACDVLVTLSGDGGVLSAARAAAPHGTPVLAVDLGRLGFLSAVRPAEVEQAFAMLLRGEFVVEERMMLDARVLRAGSTSGGSTPGDSERAGPAPQGTLVPGENAPGKNAPGENALEVGGSIGLNDAVVAKSALARILRLSIFVAGDLVADTRADGLIISTPTGSTAYALSAGGPIVHPNLPLLLICPICAHSLTQRPLIVDPDETIEVRAEWDGDEVRSSELEAMLTIDGQIGVSLQSGDTVRVRRAACTTRLLRPSGSHFYDRLRQKLRWS